jgi:hypothetical protein
MGAEGDPLASGREVCLCCPLPVILAGDVTSEQGADDQGSEGGWEEEGGFHRVSFELRLVYRRSASVAVADVPGARLALRGREGEGATLSECLTVGSRPCHHLVMLAGVVCHDGGEVDGLGHWSFRLN